MATKFRKVKGSKQSRIKTVQETTETIEHHCTPVCFKPQIRAKPKNLHKVNLGDIHVAPDGRCYSRRGGGEWLEIVALNFGIAEGRFVIMFEPGEQPHIHSHGGRTIGKITCEKEIRVGEMYHFVEAAKKSKRKGRKLIETQRYFGAIARDVIGKAPKRKRATKGTGRGAPGVPRSPFSKELVRLMTEGTSKTRAVELMVSWSRDHGHPVAGSYKTGIKQRVGRWYRRKKAETQNDVQ